MYKIKFISPKKNEVIVLDTITSEYTKYCLPKNIDYCEIGYRNEINIILNIKFFLFFAYYFYKTKKITLSSILSLCNVKDAKVVISNIDNSKLISMINSYNNKISVIMIQNGLRSPNKRHGWDQIRRLPIFFGFGKYDEELLRFMKISVDEYISSGSLKFGIYRENYSLENIKYESKYNISYISQFRENLEFNDKHKKWYDHKKKTLPYLEKLDSGFKIILNDVTESPIGKKEIEFYKKMEFLEKDKIFLKKNKNDFSSYIHCDNSKILVTYFSALAFEFYGTGAKVLFLGEIPDVKEIGQDFMGFMNNLPDCLKVTSNNLEEIKSKLNYLQNISDSEFLELTHSSRNYLMTYQKDFTHQLVKKKIIKILNDQK